MTASKSEAKKKVCFVMGGHFYTTIGGAEYQAQCIVDELKKTGAFDLYYLARKTDPAYRAEGYTLRQISHPRRLLQKGAFLDAMALMKHLRTIRPDVIYQRGVPAYAAIAAAYAKRNECKVVFHIAHDDDVSTFTRKNKLTDIVRFVDRTIGDCGIRSAHRIIAQTRAQARLLHENYGRTPTAVIGNIHPMPKEHIEKRPPLKIVWVANFKPSKRPELFVRLARDLQHLDEVEFVMIGRPGRPGLYADLHRSINGLDTLNYLGELPIERVNQILAESHVFVNTSVAEGFPNTFIQAWMRKVPVVSLSVHLDGVLDDEAVGFCSGSYEKLKDDVLRLVEQADLRSAMGERAQAHAFEAYSVESNIEKLKQVIVNH